MPCDGVLRRMIHVPARCSRSIRRRRAACRACSRATSASSASSSRRTAELRPHPRRRDHRRQHGDRVARRGATCRACGAMREWHYADGAVALKKGDEMGRFMLGSTRRPALPRRRDLGFSPAWASGRPVRLGEPMADARRRPVRPRVRAVFVDANAALRGARRSDRAGRPAAARARLRRRRHHARCAARRARRRADRGHRPHRPADRGRDALPGACATSSSSAPARAATWIRKRSRRSASRCT